MKNLEVVLKYLSNERNKIYSEILNILKNSKCKKNIKETISYVESLYLHNLKAKIYIETQKLSGEELQHQINIREDNFELMCLELNSILNKNEVTKVMKLYSKLANRDAEIFKVRNGSFFKKHKTVKKVYSEITKENKSL